MNFFKFLKKKKIEKLNRGALLFLEDKKEIIKLTKEQEKHLKIIKKISRKIILIQDSAKTLIPQFSTMHNYLRMRSRVYCNWHIKPYARFFHWLAFFLVILIIFSSFFIALVPVKAANKVWDGGGDDLLCGGAGTEYNWSCPENWDLNVVPGSGDTVAFNSTSDKNCTIDNIGTWGANGESLTITGDEDVVDGYDGTITQAVSITGMGAFSMAGANNKATFYNNADLTAESLLMEGGIFTGRADITATVNGNFDLSGLSAFSAPAILNISGNFTQTGAGTTFDATTNSSSVTFNGSSDQTITTDSDAFYELILNNTGASGSDDIIISGNININATSTITDGDLDIGTNNPTVNASGTLSIGVLGSVDITGRTANWTFNGSGIEWTDSTSGQDLGAVVIDGGGTISTTTNVKATSVNITAGDILDISDDNLTLTGTGTPLTVGGESMIILNSTITYLGDGDGAADTITLATSITYRNLTLSSTDTGANAETFQISGALNVGGDFNLTSGNFDANSLNQNYAGNVTLSSGITYTKGGILSFDGLTAKIYTDNNTIKQNIGIVSIVKTQAVDIENNNKITLASGMTVDTMTVSTNNFLTLGSSGTNNTLKLAFTGEAGAPSYTVLTVNGTITTSGSGWNSTIEYAAANSVGNINVTTITYDSLRFSGAETYVLTNDLTVGNALTGSSTIDVGATLDVVNGSNFGITLAGNWDNDGIFNARSGTVTFNGSLEQNIYSGGYGDNQDFYNVTISNTAAAVRVSSEHMKVTSGTLLVSASTIFTLDSNAQVWVSAGTLTLTGTPTYAAASSIIDYSGATYNYYGGSTGVNKDTLISDFDATDNVSIKAGTFPQNEAAAALSLTIDSGTTYTISTGDLDVGGNITINETLNGANIIYLTGNWDNNNTFSHGNGTVVFDGVTADTTQTLDNNAQAFYKLTINNTGSGTAKVQLANNDLDVNDDFYLDAGTFDSNSLNQNYAGSFTLNSGTTYTKGGNLTFDGTGNLTDNNAVPQNIGIVVIGSDSARSLQSSTTVDTLDINLGSTLALSSSDYILNLANNGATATVLTVTGTLNPGTNSIVKYSATNSGGNINVTTTTYNSLQLSGAETYVLTGNLTNTNVLTGSSTIDVGAVLDVVNGSNFGITLAGNWSNSGTFVEREGTVTFNASSGSQTIDNGSNNFYHLVLSNAGTRQLSNNNLGVNGNFNLSEGIFDANSLNQNFAGNFTITNGATYTKGGTLTFDGDSQNYTDSNTTKQNIGITTLTDTIVNLATSITVDTLNIDATSEMNLGNDSYTLKLANDGIAATVLTNLGTLTVGTSTVEYVALNSTGNVNVATIYDSVSFIGNETYVLADNIIVNSNLLIGSGATLDANGKSITLAGNWTNEGSFTHSNNLLTFNDVAKTSIISGDTTFYNFSCTIAGKTFSFNSGSTQIVAGTWTITGTSGSYITLSRYGGSGTNQWLVNPGSWAVNYVTVSNSNNLATNYIDPIYYTDGGNTTNWFPPSTVRWCDKESQYIPEDEWTIAKCVRTGPSSSEWCEAEKQHIPTSQWSAERCNVKWCEKENSYILEIEWSEERCEPGIILPDNLKWCEYEKQYILEDDWSEERCDILWCEGERKTILKISWTSERCDVQWCEALGENILKIEWTIEKCRPEQDPDGFRWCEIEEILIPEDDWIEERCISPFLLWCRREGKHIPQQDWSEERCSPLELKEKWCEKQGEYVLEDEWTDEACFISFIDRIKRFFAGPIARAIAMTGLAFGALSLFSKLLLYPLRFRDWLLILSRSLMIIFGLRKKVKPWGTVYDSVTKQPLDPAYVSIETLEGKEVASSITDLDGRYGFLIEAGIYRMVANKTNYKFPSQKLLGRISDEIYSNLYFGREIEIKEKGDVVMNDIPMDQEKFDWNEFAKKKKNLLMFHSNFDILFRKISLVFFVFGFIVSIISLILTPDSLNFIIFGFYIFITILMLFGPRARVFGSINERETGLPLSFAIVRVFAADLKREMFKRVSDKFGRYYILVPKGQYYLEIEKKNDDGSYSHILTSKIINAQSGIIKEKFVI